MKLSTKARYAVMAMVEMASGNCKNAISLTYISERQNLSLTFLEQIFLKLRRANLVKSVRGAQGGYLLAHKPEDISIYDIIVSVNEPIKTTRCVGHKDALGCQPDGARCLTHDLWSHLDSVIKLYLKSVTLNDVCSKNLEHVLFEQKAAIFNRSACDTQKVGDHVF